MNYPAPVPDDAKREILKWIGGEYNLRRFVETGTSDGGTVAEVLAFYDRIVSVELDYDNYLHCIRRFLEHPHVTVINGDSEIVLPQVLNIINEPCVLWLDAHYNGKARGAGGDTPIMSELFTAFFHDVRHVVLVDDARLFGVDPEYPTIAKVEANVKHWTEGQGRRPYRITVEDDIIKMFPT